MLNWEIRQTENKIGNFGYGDRNEREEDLIFQLQGLFAIQTIFKKKPQINGRRQHPMKDQNMAYYSNIRWQQPLNGVDKKLEQRRIDENTQQNS